MKTAQHQKENAPIVSLKLGVHEKLIGAVTFANPVPKILYINWV